VTPLDGAFTKPVASAHLAGMLERNGIGLETEFATGRVDGEAGTPVADVALAQIPVGEERELERRRRTLDRHVDHRHHQPAGVKALTRVVQGGRALKRVEVEDPLTPPRARHTVSLTRQQRRAAGDHQHVVAERLPAGQVHGVLGGLDPVDLGEPELDPVPQVLAARADDSVGLLHPERDQQLTGLIDVAVIAVDHDDLHRLAITPVHTVGRQRPRGTPSEDHDTTAHRTHHARRESTRSSAQSHTQPSGEPR
jgi:hypothetical protein